MPPRKNRSQDVSQWNVYVHLQHSQSVYNSHSSHMLSGQATGARTRQRNLFLKPASMKYSPAPFSPLTTPSLKRISVRFQMHKLLTIHVKAIDKWVLEGAEALPKFSGLLVKFMLTFAARIQNSTPKCKKLSAFARVNLHIQFTLLIGLHCVWLQNNMALHIMKTALS